jgi:hypothetical protein
MIAKTTENNTIIEIILLLSLILGYSVYLYILRRRIMTQKRQEMDVLVSNYSGIMIPAANKKSEKKLKQSVVKAERIISQSKEQMTYSIVLQSDIKLIETENCLLIKGLIESIEKICYEFSNMDQLPEGFCVQLGEWKLFILEEKPQISREDKIIVMPAKHWLLAGRKLKESINGYEKHPYTYFYEPFTFKKTMKYGIGVEATDYII